jgi:glucosylceramidase
MSSCRSATQIIQGCVRATLLLALVAIPAANVLAAPAPQTVSDIAPDAFYVIRNATSKACLDDADGSASNGAILQQWTCAAGNTNQQWMFTPTTDGFYQVATHNVRSLTWNVADNGAAPGARMQLWTYGGGLNEQFFPVKLPNGDYRFVARNSGLCLSVPGGSAKDGLRLQMDVCSREPGESFTLVKQ